ncbi:hypothetical protein JCM3775_000247 [Rhodotorula graminis]|uniref:RNase III domain-containing protein n=1 Tax=Rhodotorula graminis (strain WP1) TaxID=578459 RepID=A0A194S704_RHOGW|nr:uncharacterized protein RHOBADRAFT_42609 [Rhodotorula graminis WP1]KPV76280.1 hypothetical protein RHOBADRAFT_42609 [Rhodotorula graminis WP1]
MLTFLDENARAILPAEHPIPTIHDPALARAARARSTRVSGAHPHLDDNARFEALESLGDCCVTAAVGRAIYAHLSSEGRVPRPVIFNAYRDLLASNVTLAQLALIYNLGPSLDPPLHAKFAERETLPKAAIKILGDAFEAHAGALSIEERHVEAGDWLCAVFRRACAWAVEAVEQCTRARRAKDFASTEPLVAFSVAVQPSTSSPSPPTPKCGCSKRALSIFVRERGLRYDTETQPSFHTRLVFNNGDVFAATETTKQLAEQEAARRALSVYAPERLRPVNHACCDRK